MSFSVGERPGVYSSFEASSISSGTAGSKACAVAAVATSGNAGELYKLTNQREAEAAFGIATKEKPMTELCRLLFLNGASMVYAVPVSGSEAEYKAAFALLKDEDAGVCICDSEELLIQQALRDMVRDASESRRERIAVLSLGGGSNEELLTRAAGINSERCALVAPAAATGGVAGESGIWLAAAVAGVVAAATDPALPFHGAALRGLAGVSRRFEDSDITSLVRGGVLPCECVAGETTMVRGITTKTKTGDAPDATWRELTTVLVADNVIASVRNALRSKFSRAKNTEATRTAIKSQVAVELEKKKAAQIIDGYAGLSAVQSGEDAGVCIVEFEFAVSRGLNQIFLGARILV